MKNINIELPEGFLEQEEIDGYVVTEEMKKIWAVELDLFMQLKRVCDKYHLTYFADGGTLIGAVRHHGFIPWDDDMDFAMKRSDYEKLCQVAEEEFKYPYFFQTEYTDPGSQRGHAQLRNSLTTGIRQIELGRRFTFNQGIFVDIFILDNLPDDLNERQKFVTKVNAAREKFKKYARISTRYEKKSGLKGIIKAAVHGIVGSKNNIQYKKFDKLAMKYKDDNTEECGMITLQAFNSDYYFKNQWLNKTKEIDFSFTKIPVPYEYEKYLDKEYKNDWRIPKAVPSLHGDMIYNVSQSYINYFNEH